MAALKKQTAAGFSLFLYNLAHLASEKKVRKKQWKELKSDEKQSRRNYKRIYERKGEEMLGGGSFLAQDKVLPGTYMNFVNAGAASPVIGIRDVYKRQR